MYHDFDDNTVYGDPTPTPPCHRTFRTYTQGGESAVLSEHEASLIFGGDCSCHREDDDDDGVRPEPGEQRVIGAIFDRKCLDESDGPCGKYASDGFYCSEHGGDHEIPF